MMMRMMMITILITISQRFAPAEGVPPIAMVHLATPGCHACHHNPWHHLQSHCHLCNCNCHHHRHLDHHYPKQVPHVNIMILMIIRFIILIIMMIRYLT